VSEKKFDYIPEIKDITNPQLAMVPVSGDKMTMNEEDAALIINQMKPEITAFLNH
jgi:hypothetical protein